MTDQEQLHALETERAYLLANGKTERAGQVDDQITAVRDRIAAARVAAGLETADGPAPSETKAQPKGRRRPPDGS